MPTSRGSHDRTERLMPVTYSSYLKLDELLSLQQPLSDGPEHDETLFIIIHQVYELWFKELIHEVDYLMALLAKEDTARAQHTLKRVLTILKVLVAIYRGDAVLASLCERLVDLDEGVQEWRYRHVKMVQRTIGTKAGTGGSAGAAYLMTTLNKPYFPDLWEIRAEL